MENPGSSSMRGTKTTVACRNSEASERIATHILYNSTLALAGSCDELGTIRQSQLSAKTVTSTNIAEFEAAAIVRRHSELNCEGRSMAGSVFSPIGREKCIFIAYSSRSWISSGEVVVNNQPIVSLPCFLVQLLAIHFNRSRRCLNDRYPSQYRGKLHTVVIHKTRFHPLIPSQSGK